MSRRGEFDRQIAGIKKSTPPTPITAEKAAAKTQSNGGS